MPRKQKKNGFAFGDIEKEKPQRKTTRKSAPAKPAVTEKKSGSGGHNIHVPTPKNISDVENMIKSGVQTKHIATHLGITEPTLFNHYRDVMNKARATAHMAIGMSIYKQALQGNVKAQIWYSKTQMEWSDKPQQSALERIGEEVVKKFHMPSNGRDKPAEQTAVKATQKPRRTRKVKP